MQAYTLQQKSNDWNEMKTTVHKVTWLLHISIKIVPEGLNICITAFIYTLERLGKLICCDAVLPSCSWEYHLTYQIGNLSVAISAWETEVCWNQVVRRIKQCTPFFGQWCVSRHFVMQKLASRMFQISPHTRDSYYWQSFLLAEILYELCLWNWRMWSSWFRCVNLGVHLLWSCKLCDCHCRLVSGSYRYTMTHLQ
jgi:hypothetical protein